MGILNIVVGSLTLLCGLCDIGGYALLGSLMNAPGGNEVVEELKYLEKHLPGYMWLEVGRDVVVVVLAVLLVLAGVGLLATRSWGRWLSIIYAFVSIPLHVGWAIYKLGVVLPLADQFQKEYARQHPQAATENVYLTGAIIILAITILPLVYCLVLLVFMFLPGLSAVFARDRRGARRHEDREYEDGHDEEETEDDYDDYDERWHNRY
jgi:hypothetical protein